MIDTVHTWITRVPLFEKLDASTIAALEAAIHVRAYPKGGAIVLEGHRSTGLCIVVAGLVRVYRMTADGRLHVHHYLRPYSLFNLIPALDGRPNPTSVEAVIDSQVAWLPGAALMHLMTLDARLLAGCLQTLAEQNRELMARLEDLGFRTVPARLARLLLQRGGFESEVDIPLSTLSQDEIAAVLGTSREVLGRALRQLYDLGLVRRESGRYVIIDRAGLEKLAGE
ncbi:MAG TPA: Crp/Fnr family transcriptional regulator [Aggregatilineales bacterium]|nr:Crp/Fnr family transcriptional regulator [Aggregatilineales bacterium]